MVMHPALNTTPVTGTADQIKEPPGTSFRLLYKSIVLKLGKCVSLASLT